MTASWEKLLAKAFIIIDEIERMEACPDGMALGGGTALMLQIDHRVSHDIDFFLPDPQLLAYAAAAVADLEAWLPGVSYRGDGSRYLKIAIEGEGEIDFIAAPPATGDRPVERTLLGRSVPVNTVPEIIASKVVYRGDHLLARDIFDIAAACESGHREAVRHVLADIPEHAAAAHARVGMLPKGRLADLVLPQDIRPGFEHLLAEAPAIALEVLEPRREKTFGRRRRSAPKSDDDPSPGF
ncbi:MAG: nucleotidyl transferase AbiEii/AbiGii toxin family protein [Albidovulum sp.]|nr:nucleotidyl transferase AbiEii/AbiGii toxin family protein [Albidovulum sp.]